MGLCASSPGNASSPEGSRKAPRKKQSVDKSRTIKMRVRGKTIRTRSPSLLAEDGINAVAKPKETTQLILDSLSANSFFNSRTPTQLEVLAGVTELQDVSAQSEVYKKGDEGDFFYIMPDGKFEKRAMLVS